MKHALDRRQLEAMLDRLNTTGCIVTAAYGRGRDGCYVSFITPASIDPARVIVLTSHENLTHDLVERSRMLALHPLVRGQEGWIELFGRRSGRDVDKFAGLAWHAGATGSPLLDDAAGYIEGRVLRSMNCGDHTARLVEPVAAELRSPEAAPLTMFELFARGLIQPAASLGDPWPAFAPTR